VQTLLNSPAEQREHQARVKDEHPNQENPAKEVNHKACPQPEVKQLGFQMSRTHRHD
jgi:hypothetical protein